MKSYTVKSSSIYNHFFASAPEYAPTLNALQDKYKTEDRNTALRRAAHEGCVQDIEVLVKEYQADIKSCGSNGYSALDWAYFNGHMSAVNTLCWLGADQSLLKRLLTKYVTDTESEWPTKNQALCRAAEKGNGDDIRLLVTRYRADLHCTLENKLSPLLFAKQNGHAEAVTLIEALITEQQAEADKKAQAGLSLKS